jgi:hypothetical protein
MATPYLPYTANTITRLGDRNVDSRGSITGSFRFILAGQEALDWRQESLLNDEDEVKKNFDAYFRGWCRRELRLTSIISWG